MVKIIESILDIIVDFINKVFLLEVEFATGNFIPIGKIVVAFLFLAYTLYFILDAMGIINSGGDE